MPRASAHCLLVQCGRVVRAGLGLWSDVRWGKRSRGSSEPRLVRLPMSSSNRSARVSLPVWRAARRLVAWIVLAAGCAERPAELANSLPSWNDTGVKAQIIDFVHAVTTVGTPDFVPAADRIAVFDNDGTLWTEQPMYTQIVFAIDQAKLAAPSHPEWTSSPVFKALMAHDEKALAATWTQASARVPRRRELGHDGRCVRQDIRDWLASAQHPTLHRPYTDLVYAPMQDS